jgi:hypothetical protein
MGGTVCDTARAGRSIRCGRILGVVCLLAAIGCCLALAPAALASATSFTWTGRSGVLQEEWSLGSNWEGNVAPTAEEAVGTLTFPRLTNPSCAAAPETEACYFSFNDLIGLSAESVHIDDGDGYFITGEELTVGSGGLTASPASGSTGAAGDFVLTALHLGASQRWSITDRIGGAVEENGLLLGGEVTGAQSALTTELSNGSALILANNTEVGPVTIEGPNAGGERIDNGSVLLEGGELNSSDRHPLELTHVFFAGTGAVGPLTTDGSTLDVGDDEQPAGALHAASVELDSAGAAVFEVVGEGTVAQNDYSQLVSEGPVELAGSAIGVVVRPESPGGACPVLVAGRTYTFISTTAALSGSFANAPEGGPEIPIEFAKGCSQVSQTMQIGYHRNGATETVTGTVEGQSFERESSKSSVGETAVGPVPGPPARPPAIAGVLSAHEGSPDARLADASLQVSRSGAVSIKISCPLGERSCAGTVTLRTPKAVIAGGARAAKEKARILTVATGSFTVPGGKTKTITLHLSTKARVLLERIHLLRVRARIVAHDPAGVSHVTQTIATLHAPKARHGSR